MQFDVEKIPMLHSRPGKVSMPRHLTSLIYDFHSC